MTHEEVGAAGAGAAAAGAGVEVAVWPLTDNAPKARAAQVRTILDFWVMVGLVEGDSPISQVDTCLAHRRPTAVYDKLSKAGANMIAPPGASP